MSPEMKRGPMSPAEAAELQIDQIPDEVYVAFNGLIAQNLIRGRSTVVRESVIKILEGQGLDRKDIFDKHWLDVEPAYEAQGWKVTYGQPVGYAGENFEPYYEFEAKGKK